MYPECEDCSQLHVEWAWTCLFPRFLNKPMNDRRATARRYDGSENLTFKLIPRKQHL